MIPLGCLLQGADAMHRSRTTRKMREALHDFALVARGLDGTVYGDATS
jgi:hypothetical protein